MCCSLRYSAPMLLSAGGPDAGALGRASASGLPGRNLEGHGYGRLVHIQIMAFIYCSNILRCCINFTVSIVSSEVEMYPNLRVANDFKKKSKNLALS